MQKKRLAVYSASLSHSSYASESRLSVSSIFLESSCSFPTSVAMEGSHIFSSKDAFSSSNFSIRCSHFFKSFSFFRF